jgi:hypothetical protein
MDFFANWEKEEEECCLLPIFVPMSLNRDFHEIAIFAK